MKERLTTLIFAIAAVLLSIILLVPAESPTVPISLPTTVDQGADGLMGLFRWLEDNKTPVISLRKPFTHLTEAAELDATGNLLILSLPQQRKVLDAEWQALQDWIARGNTVIALGAGYFSPGWAGTECFCEFNQLLNGFGWNIDAAQAIADEDDVVKAEEQNFAQSINNITHELKALLPVHAELQPQSGHSLLQAVRHVQSQVTQSLLKTQWIIKSEKDALALNLLVVSKQQDVTAMWQVEAGNGQILLSLTPGIFSNKTLNKADNARLFANILALNKTENGRVIFDDFHFGLSEGYDPQKFFADSRLHKTIGFIALLWLFYVLGYSNRLAPVRAIEKKPSARDFVEAMAGFFSRYLDKKTLAQSLTRQLLHDIRQHRHMQNEQAAWHWLQQHPGIQGSQLELLQKAETKQRTSLQLLTNTITEIRKKILL